MKSPRILSVEDIDIAVKRLLSGELVAFPTETVYGLGADARQEDAVAKIYQAKGRPTNHPVIVHLAEGADLTPWARDIPDVAYTLINAFWPGPLTLIFKRAEGLPSAVCGGQESVGIRCPDHPVAQLLLKAFMAQAPHGIGGLGAPSANQFGHVSPTTAEHVVNEFKNQDIWVLSGGDSMVGIESTILDLSRFDEVGLVLLRPGHIQPEEIEQATGLRVHRKDIQAPQVSGSLKAHYATRTPILWVSDKKSLNGCGLSVVLMAYRPEVFEPMDNVKLIKMPENPVDYARVLYASMREADVLGVGKIAVQRLPENSEWSAVNDRLSRAVAHYE